MTFDVVVHRGKRDLVVVAGNDAASYLHGQLSQNIEILKLGGASWSLLLSPQGKVDAWLRVTRRDKTEFVLDVDHGFGADVAARLERFKLRVDCTISSSETDCLSIRGSGSSEFLALIRCTDRGTDQQAESGNFSDAGGEIRPSLSTDDHLSTNALIDLPEGSVASEFKWAGFSGFDILGEAVAADALPAGVEVCSDEKFEALRILHGVPSMGSELTASTIPAEAGIVDISVDFSKGCYVGQELVARVDSRGNNTPRNLALLRLAGRAELPNGAEIVQDGQLVGSITSSAEDEGQTTVALGYVIRRAQVPGPAIVGSADIQLEGEIVALSSEIRLSALRSADVTYSLKP